MNFKEYTCKYIGDNKILTSYTKYPKMKYIYTIENDDIGSVQLLEKESRQIVKAINRTFGAYANEMIQSSKITFQYIHFLKEYPPIKKVIKLFGKTIFTYWQEHKFNSLEEQNAYFDSLTFDYSGKKRKIVKC